jgi:transposase
MHTPDDVASILRLSQLGYGSRRIALELNISRNTVRSYLRQGGWSAFRSASREKSLDQIGPWLEQAFFRHAGNADVVRQELVQSHGIAVSLRTVERAVRPFREHLQTLAKATLRFETPPGHQLQIDFGSLHASIDNQQVRIFLFVATLGYSRRLFVSAYLHERQAAWLGGLEGAFAHFGGVPHQVLIDNPKALVTRHDPQTREVVFAERFLAFSRYWGFSPRACAPYRARTKGKDESGVKYVKRNAIAGRTFTSWEDLQSHLARWTREIADQRIHGTTGERPLDRFDRHERSALRSLDGRTPFQQQRELERRVGNDACVEVDSNAYSVPWRLIGRRVSIQIANQELVVLDSGVEVARHPMNTGTRQRIIERSHLIGIVGARSSPVSVDALKPDPRSKALLRPLTEYEAAVGGGW